MANWYEGIDQARVVVVQRGKYGGAPDLGYHFHFHDRIKRFPLVEQEAAVRYMLELMDNGCVLVPSGFQLAEVYDDVLAVKRNLASEIIRLAEKIQ